MDFKLKNYMEKAVEDKYNEIINQTDFCKCEVCKADAIAIALNHLPLKYIVCDGYNVAKLNMIKIKFDEEIYNELTKAFEIVSKEPHH